MLREAQAMTEPLVAALVDHRDDVERYLVLADELQTRGDPHGELIAIQCRLASAPTDEVRERERELIAGFEAQLRGGLPETALSFDWRFGFVQRVVIKSEVTGHLPTWKRIGDHRCFQLLRAIQFHQLSADDALVVPALDAMLEAKLANVERLTLGTPAWIPANDVLAELLAHFPRVHAFELAAVQPPALPMLARMSELALWVTRVELSTLDSLVAAPMPALNRLVLGLPSRRPRASEIYVALAPILDGTAHPKLEHLAVMNARIEDTLIADLPTRPLVTRLRSLGLRWDQLSQSGGEPALERARAAFDKIELVWPQPPGAELTGKQAYQLGVLLRVKLGRAAEALPYYAQACAQTPADVAHWWAYGNALGDLDRRDEQLDAFARALEIDPKHPSALSNRGRALRELGRFDDAIDSFTRAIEGTPTHVSAWNELGNLHRRFGRVDEAIVSFERALAIDPKHHAGRSLFDALLEYRRPEEALRLIETLRAAQPEDEQLARKQGRAHLALGNPATTLEIAMRLCETTPTDYWNQYLRLCALRDLGRTVDAIAVCIELERDTEPFARARGPAATRADLGSARAARPERARRRGARWVRGLRDPRNRCRRRAR